MRFLFIVFLLTATIIPSYECSFSSRIRSRVLFQSPFTILQGKPKEVKIDRSRGSALQVVMGRAKKVTWRQVVAVVGAGILTSVAMKTIRRELEVSSAISDPGDSFDLSPIDTFGRLDDILSGTSLGTRSDTDSNGSTSVLLVIDSNDSQRLEEDVELRTSNINLIAAEVAKARSAGDKVCARFMPSFHHCLVRCCQCVVNSALAGIITLLIGASPCSVMFFNFSMRRFTLCSSRAP